MRLAFAQREMESGGMRGHWSEHPSRQSPPMRNDDERGYTGGIPDDDDDDESDD